eukprot:TRINITY_DN10955_c0_g1_i1.p1 TRINITY_DN10955_c0_g1~~TRINITY_DN10955_c0_g1_i1.p1  ORF type:complete len:383 (+),score=52.08 TRINITY_DN10955_c0_g1_i1:92-1240(+)
MNALPEELLCHILLNLSHFSLAQCESVSKKWSRISKSLWRDLYLRDEFPTAPHEVLGRGFGQYRRLTLELLDQPWKERYLDASFARERNMILIDYKYRFSNRIALTTPLEAENTLLFKFEGSISQVRTNDLYVHLKDSTRRDVLVKRKNLDDLSRGKELHTGDDVTLLCVSHNEGAVLKILKYRVKQKRPLVVGIFPRSSATLEALFLAASPLILSAVVSLAPHSPIMRGVLVVSRFLPYTIKRVSNFITMIPARPTLQIHLPLAAFVELVLASSNAPLYLDIVAMCSRFYILWFWYKLFRERLVSEQRLQWLTAVTFGALILATGEVSVPVDWTTLITRAGVAWLLTNLERPWYTTRSRGTTVALMLGCWILANLYLPKVF